MKIYPAIDIKSGRCVRLTQGCYEKVTIYSDDVVAIAKSYAQQGAEMLHVVDLDGAKGGKSINFDLITDIATHTDLHIQVGGGIRTKQQVKKTLDHGITRVVLGSVAILQPNTVKAWLNEFGPECVVVALDVRMDNTGQPQLVVEGWQTPSAKRLWQLLDEYRGTPLKHVLCTDIERDGVLGQPNFQLYQECVHRYPQLNFQASGGVSSLQDLNQLQALSVSGVIIGKALYEHKFSLHDALTR